MCRGVQVPPPVEPPELPVRLLEQLLPQPPRRPPFGGQGPEEVEPPPPLGQLLAQHSLVKVGGKVLPLDSKLLEPPKEQRAHLGTEL